MNSPPVAQPTRGVVLIVALWILAILTLLAVGTGYQTSLELKLVRYHRDRLKAEVLAQTGLNRAIAVLEEDSPDADFLAEAWATGIDPSDPEKFLFKEIPLEEQGTWVIRYLKGSDPINNPDGEPEPVYAVRDEERKINLNTAGAVVLNSLLEKIWPDLDPPPQISSQDMVQAIRAWRGDREGGDPLIYQESWYLPEKPKDSPFEQLEELFLFHEMSVDLFDKLKDEITVYGEGKVNVNTTAEEILTVLGLDADLTHRLVSLRQDRLAEHPPQPLFEQQPTVASVQQLLGLQQSDLRVTQEFVDRLTVQSKAFRIEAVGATADQKIQRIIEAVVEMDSQPGRPRQLSRYRMVHDG